jgi:23S rRNA pseudouridine2605 synthase
MLNKPRCYITSLKDEKDRKIVTDLLKDVKEKVFPVGRLDYNTEGLLLLTNDGDWANEITHPSKHIAKTYEVKLKYPITSKQAMQINNGILIDDRKTLPAKIKLVKQSEDFFVYYITIYEGRNREVRKMFEHLNLKIYNLKRLSIGSLQLGNLEMGKYKILNKQEINKVFMEEIC